MFSRRTILGLLGSTAVAAVLPTCIPATAAPMPLAMPLPRTRGWQVRLEGDGSSTWVDGERRFLDEWVKSGDPVFEDISGNWKGSYFQLEDGLKEKMQSIIEFDTKAVAERSKNPFQEVFDYCHQNGLEPPTLEAEFYKGGLSDNEVVADADGNITGRWNPLLSRHPVAMAS